MQDGNLLGGLERWVKVLKAEHIIKKVIKNDSLSSLLGSILNPILNLISKKTIIKKNQYIVSELTTFDNDFDTLWDKASPQYNTLAQRDSNYLNWKYKDKIILTVKEEKELCAYAVLELKDDQAAIIDIFSHKDKQVVEILITAINKYCQTKNVATISFSCLENNYFLSYLSTFGFMKRKNEKVVMGNITDENINEQEFYNPNNWLLTLGDCDIESIL